MVQLLDKPKQGADSSLMGEALLAENHISVEELDEVLAEQQRSGGLFVETLAKISRCNVVSLYQKLAARLALPFANLYNDPPESQLLQRQNVASYLDIMALPWKQQGDVVHIATSNVTDEVTRWASKYYPNHQFAITTPRDIHHALRQHYPDYFSAESTNGLWRRSPELSAKETFTANQIKITALLLGALCGLCVLFPLFSFVIALFVVNLFCLATLLFKTMLFVTGYRKRKALWKKAESYPLIPDDKLPIYTILVPMYDEAATLPHLLNAVRAIDYPASKLDIKLVLEADDHATLEAAKALRPEGRFEIITVPPSYPRTKPKACNYALRFAKGELVTIYDAEDKPDPQQLRKVVHFFRNAKESLVCVQCRLNYYNREQSILTRLFSIEYAAWFDYMLPGLDWLQLPIPLGGTSNHIHLQRLIELGEWDPYNVTEDADLGIRMAFARYHTATLNSETLEEAPASLWAWIKQRTRWIKGYMQTWLVHMRHPVRLFKRLGSDGFWGFQFFIGGPCLVFLSTPILIMVSIYYFYFSEMASSTALQAALPLSSLVLAYSLLLHFILAIEVVWSRKWMRMAPIVLLFPVYWVLHSLAGFRALWQLLTRPHYWDKTAHGLTNGYS